MRKYSSIAGCSLLLSALLLPVLSCGGKSSNTVPTPPSGDGSGTLLAPNSNKTGDSTLLPSALANDPMGVTIHELSNGMRVYISEDTSTPSISSWIAVRAGSRHDPADSTGLAHYLEHMLFKGTSKMGSLDFAKEEPHLKKIEESYTALRSAKTPEERTAILKTIDSETVASSQYAVPNEFDNLYSALGIDGLNAFTSNEQTVYVATVPSNRFETWTKIEGERFANPQFRLFYPELETVYEELNRSLDNPNSRMFHALFKGLFPNHPYGTQPTIGHPEHLKNPAYADMKAYFDTWYRPNNMAIVLAGDINAERALPALEAAFAGLKPQALPELPASSLEAPSTRTEVSIVAPGEQSIYMAWPTVPVGHPDEIALQAMDLIVDNSATGLLNIELVLSQKLPRAGSFNENMSEAGTWVLTATAREGQSLEEVESLLMGVIAKLKAGDFSQEDLSAIIINTEISQKRQMESNGARVQMMADAFVVGRSWQEVVNEQERLKAVTRDDVVRVANTYLSDAPVVVKRKRGEFAGPKVDKPSITAIKIDSSKMSPYAKAIREAPAKQLEPEYLQEGSHYERSSLAAGDFVSVKNPKNDLFNIEYQFKTGEKDDPYLCLGMSLLELSGAGNQDAKELQKSLYAIGTTIQFVCRAQDSYVVVSGVDRMMEQSLAILNEWLSTPKVAPDALAKLKANTLSTRKDAMGEPRVIADALMHYAFYGKNSEYLKVLSNSKVKSASEKVLLASAKGLLNIKHRTSYLGPRSMSQVAPLIALGQNHKDAPKQTSLRYAKVRKPTLYFVNQKVAQAQVRIGYPAQAVPLLERVKAHLFSQYVGGGMGGLIFQEIREARGLAYSAWSYYSNNSKVDDDSALIAGLGTQADKTIEALQTMMGLISPLKVEESRFATAKTSLDAGYRKARFGPRERGDAIFSWADLGLSSDPRAEQYTAMLATNSDAMAKFANAKTSVSPIVAILGDATRIDLKALSKATGIRTTKKLTIKQIFGY